jgi:hypothetical protein
MNWRIKGVAQKLLSTLPGGVSLNDVLQRRAGGLRHFPREVASRVLDDWVVIASYMKELGVGLAGLSYVEIGTGWIPTLPVCYALAGARSVSTFDLTRHLNHRLTHRLLDELEPLLPSISEACGQSLSVAEKTLAELRASTTTEELFRRACIDYRAPANAAHTDLSDESVDVVFSNNVLEHVRRSDIVGIMHESHRILRKGGLAIHCVNPGDHYAYFDRSITRINYLAYTDRQWSFWNNRLLYQNRLRPVDFIRMTELAGFDIVLQRNEPEADLLSKLPLMKTASEFNCYAPEELCCTSIGFVARKP